MNQPRLRLGLWTCALTVAVSACSGGNASGPNALPLRSAGSFARVRAAAKWAMYVGSFDGIGVYDGASGKLIRRITDGVDIAIAVIADPSGTVYVANGAGGPHGQGAIEVFARGGSQRLREIRHGLDGPFALALDSKGNLYAANQMGNSVTVYTPKGKLLRTITDGVGLPVALALDGSDDLFVANTAGSGSITQYAAESKVAQRTITDDVHLPLGLLVDASGNVYVANDYGSDVTAYRPGKTKVWRRFKNGINKPQSMAFDASGALYVGDYHGRVVKLDVATGEVLTTIETGMNEPRAMAVDPSGHLVVVNYGSGSQRGEVNVYDATGTRLHQITDRILSPTSLTFGPR